MSEELEQLHKIRHQLVAIRITLFLMSIPLWLLAVLIGFGG